MGLGRGEIRYVVSLDGAIEVDIEARPHAQPFLTAQLFQTPEENASVILSLIQFSGMCWFQFRPISEVWDPSNLVNSCRIVIEFAVGEILRVVECDIENKLV